MPRRPWYRQKREGAEAQTKLQREEEAEYTATPPRGDLILLVANQPPYSSSEQTIEDKQKDQNLPSTAHLLRGGDVLLRGASRATSKNIVAGVTLPGS